MQLFNGDWKEIAKSIKDNSVDAIITDPPFGVDFFNDIYDDTKENIEKQMVEWFKLMYDKLKENSHCYVFVGVKTLNLWIDAGIKAGFKYKNLIASKIYDSYKYAGGSNFKFNFQPIIFFSKGNPKQMNKVNFFPTSDSWFNDKRNKNPQRYTYSYSSFIDKEICFSNVKTNKILKHFHNSEKNVKLLKFLVEISTNKNDVILDPFMGSGSTGEACITSGRDFIGIEINKEIYNPVEQKLIKMKNNNK